LEASPTKNFGLIFWFTNGNLCFWFCSLGKGELNQVEFTRSQALSTIENGGRRDASESARASRRTASKTRRDSGFDDTETGHRQGTARRTPFQKHPLMISDPWPTLELFFQQLPKNYERSTKSLSNRISLFPAHTSLVYVAVSPVRSLLLLPFLIDSRCCYFLPSQSPMGVSRQHRNWRDAKNMVYS